MTGVLSLFPKSLMPSLGKIQALGIDYEHRLIDDMVAAALKWNGKFV